MGNNEEELVAVEELLALLDRDEHPLTASDLLVRRMLLRHSTGREFAALTDVREAVRLSAPYPTIAEHALAMAELAHAELWNAVPGASTPTSRSCAPMRRRGCSCWATGVAAWSGFGSRWGHLPGRWPTSTHD